MTLSAAAPMGMDIPMGSTPSRTEKTMSSSSASQNEGVLERTRQKPRIHLSGHRPRLAPAASPSPRPSPPDSSQAETSSQRELESRWPITSSTGRR